jgi:hypothetical protein
MQNLLERLEQLATALGLRGVPAVLAVWTERGWRVEVTAGADLAELLQELAGAKAAQAPNEG